MKTYLMERWLDPKGPEYVLVKPGVSSNENGDLTLVWADARTGAVVAMEGDSGRQGMPEYTIYDLEELLDRHADKPDPKPTREQVSEMERAVALTLKEAEELAMARKRDQIIALGDSGVITITYDGRKKTKLGYKRNDEVVTRNEVVIAMQWAAKEAMKN